MFFLGFSSMSLLFSYPVFFSLFHAPLDVDVKIELGKSELMQGTVLWFLLVGLLDIVRKTTDEM